MKKQFDVPEIVELDFKDTSYIGAKKRSLFVTSAVQSMSRDCWNLMTGYFAEDIEEGINEDPEDVDVDDNW